MAALQSHQRHTQELRYCKINLLSELPVLASCQIKVYDNKHKKKLLIQVIMINVGHCPLGSYEGVVSFVVTLAGFDKDMVSFLF